MDENRNGEPQGLFERNLSIPFGVRSFAYIVGMVGFPVLIATYVIMQLSADIRSVDKRLEELALQIDERPMSIDRTTDFVNYVTDSLRSELENEVTALIEDFDFSFSDEAQVIKKVNVFINELQSVVRPIVRKHQRFASRFPSIGGNLGGYFTLSAPAETQTAGDTEAYLAALSNKDFAESVTVVIANLLSDYGDERLSKMTINASTSDQDPDLAGLMAFLGNLNDVAPNEALDVSGPGLQDDPTTSQPIGARVPVSASPAPFLQQSAPPSNMLIDREIMLRMTTAVINSTTIGLRDQILLNVRLNSAQTLD